MTSLTQDNQTLIKPHDTHWTVRKQRLSNALICPAAGESLPQDPDPSRIETLLEAGPDLQLRYLGQGSSVGETGLGPQLGI